MKSKKQKRLDALLVEHGLASSLKNAHAMILAGEVQIDGVRADKPGAQFSADLAISVSSRTLKYASRGGVKMEGALAEFCINPSDCVCLDIGSSTGGFTDCLLQHGAARVYAVDVNVAQLDWKLRQDPRVIPIKRNARDLRSAEMAEMADIVTIDLSFISVGKVLAPAVACAKNGAQFLILVKPQFELPREDVGAHGIVKDPALHEKAVSIVRQAAVQAGLEILGVKPSRIAGAEGNQEFFIHARKTR